MKKTLIPILFSAAISFFFTAKGETNFPGIVLKQEFSGFKTMAECDAFRAEYKEYLALLGSENVAVSQCARQDTL